MLSAHVQQLPGEVWGAAKKPDSYPHFQSLQIMHAFDFFFFLTCKHRLEDLQHDLRFLSGIC